MLTKALIIITLFFSNLVAITNFIALKLDAYGQSEYHLNEINPFYEVNPNIGCITLNSLDHLPNSSRLVNFNFIGLIDSSNVTSQFNYSRGDYSFRETKVIANNPLSNNSNLLFKAHGRKYPGKFNSLGTDYILQNYFVHYINNFSDKIIEFTKYYHNEDVNLPIENFNKSRFSEIDGLGISLNIKDVPIMFNKKTNIDIKFQNIFYKGLGYSEVPDLIEKTLQENHVSFLSSIWLSNRTFFEISLEYKKAELKLIDSFKSTNVGEVSLLYKHLLNKKHIFEFGFYSVSILDKVYPIFHYQFRYDEMWLICLKRASDIEVFNVFEIHPNESVYDMISIERDFYKSKLNLSFFDVKIGGYNPDIISDNGQIAKFSFKIGALDNFESKIEDLSFLDMVGLNLILHDYIDYGPIDYNLNLNLVGKYLKSTTTSSYVPFIDLEYNYISLNPGYSLNYSSLSIFNEEGFNAIKFGTSKVELGLIFNNFVISYNLLNIGSDYYFPEHESNINIPIYPMNYLNVKWQFQD